MGLPHSDIHSFRTPALVATVIKITAECEPIPENSFR